MVSATLTVCSSISSTTLWSNSYDYRGRRGRAPPLNPGEFPKGDIRHEDRRLLLAEVVLPNAVLVDEEGTLVYGQGEGLLAHPSRQPAAELDPYRSGFRHYCCGQAYGLA